jgi:hypothetical protein
VDKALDELGEKVCALYPFICELCYKERHFNFQCSGHNNDLSNPMSTQVCIVMTRSLPISMISLLYFWSVKSYLERLLW